MALKEFKNLPDRTTPINSSNLNYNFNEILNLIYPIGRGFIDFTNTDYSNYLGFTWERELVGMTAVGLDTSQTEFNTIGKTGGEKNHTILEHEIPKQFARYKSGNFVGQYVGLGNGNIEADITSQYPMSLLQPYKVVSYWKRTA